MCLQFCFSMYKIRIIYPNYFDREFQILNVIKTKLNVLIHFKNQYDKVSLLINENKYLFRVMEFSLYIKKYIFN